MSVQLNRQAGPFDLTKNGSGPRPGQHARKEYREQGVYRHSPLPYTGASDLAGRMEYSRKPQPGHSFEAPRPMERVAARAPELRGGSKGTPKREPRFIRMFRSEKDKKPSEFDRITISEPLAVAKNAPIVIDYCPPSPSTRPARPTRPEDHRSHAPSGSRKIHQGPAMPLPPQILTNVKIYPSKLAAGRNDWREAHPVVPASLSKPRLHESEEERGLYSKRSRRSYNLDRMSITAALDDDEAVSVGVAVSPNNPDASFSEPSPEQDEREMSVKQARRRGMVFKPADIDVAVLAGQWFGGDDDVPGAGSDQELEIAEDFSFSVDIEDFDGGESEDHENDNDQSVSQQSGLDAPEIRVTAPSRSVSVVSNQYLSPDHAWKRIAERCRREAKREHDDADEILELCAPLMAAFELIKTVPDFAHLDSWDGAFELMQEILEERKLNARERDAANARAVWFQQQWWALHQEVARLRSEQPASHEA
jgi:hypothetical protein